jgi:hypothetical protein
LASLPHLLRQMPKPYKSLSYSGKTFSLPPFYIWGKPDNRSIGAIVQQKSKNGPVALCDCPFLHAIPSQSPIRVKFNKTQKR